MTPLQLPLVFDTVAQSAWHFFGGGSLCRRSWAPSAIVEGPFRSVSISRRYRILRRGDAVELTMISVRGENG